MRFTPDDDLRLFGETVDQFLVDHATPEAVRAWWEDRETDAGRWKGLADLGALSLTVPEEHAGMGLDERALVLLLQSVGRAALPEPVGDVVAVSVPLLAEIGGDLAKTWLPRIANGEARVLPALDASPYPAHLATADLVLVQQGPASLVAVDPSALEVVEQANVDPGRPTSRVVRVDGPAVDVDPGALIRAAQRGAFAASAEMLGAASKAIEVARDYALQREQFGKPIGSFQAVKHLLASALVDVEFSRPLVERAAYSLATGAGETAEHVSAAKAFVSQAAQEAAKAALQVHGAIGYTWECDLQLWMKRIWSLTAAWGDTEAHWAVVEDSLLG